MAAVASSTVWPTTLGTAILSLSSPPPDMRANAMPPTTASAAMMPMTMAMVFLLFFLPLVLFAL